ncbi:MAG: hypothetical protein A2928_04035 [Candidatus Taylorbacteria bacterium RIFCSPLOWO2_01_FULL_45_15b]|uniref:Uncharacterized protein n=1 Tax=Candidatus Taylorbacteria bacterium RIFCSPLOWO2_01_FULL_45_15b TaxID=1802319 RepID=A0A1G2NG32_9BACT|nr:MAG: hypothetical protein A2928_04035 [Candidatus Taylorbacteria bacterium RIFCSPLOWO2_01_FULL_45_15b]
MDCQKLSPKARKIFNSLKPYFPPDPWGKARWKKDGRVCDNGEFDLRKSEDKDKIQHLKRLLIGHELEMMYRRYREKYHLPLEGISNMPLTPLLKDTLEITRLLAELDYQIETGDFAD